MFHLLAPCSFRLALPSGRALAAGAGLAMLAVLGTLPSLVAPPASEDFGAPMILRAATPAALRDQAEALRASLLATPGVGAVMMTGLHQQSLAVEYIPSRLTGLGVTAENLAVGLPVDAAHSRPGHLALRTDASLDSPQDVVGLPVHAGARVFRLGDIAIVSRAPLNPPVSTLTIDGRPAVRVTVVRTR